MKMKSQSPKTQWMCTVTQLVIWVRNKLKACFNFLMSLKDLADQKKSEAHFPCMHKMNKAEHACKASLTSVAQTPS